MKTHWIIVLTIILLAAFNAQASVTQVPDIMSAPVVLYDEGNNLLGDGDYTVTIALKDKNGTYLYSEEQNISVKNGVAHLVLGTGYAVGSAFASPAGGLSYDVFNVDGDVSVEVLVEGQASPQEITILSSHPYSFISQYAVTVANDAVTSNKIKDGTINSEDLDQQFLSTLLSQKNSGVPLSNDDDPNNALDGTISARDVAVSSDIGLNNAGGDTVYKVFQGLDSAIDTLREVDIKQTVLKLMTNTDDSIAKLNNDVSATMVNLSGDINQVSNKVTIHSSTTSDVHGIKGVVVGTEGSQTLTNKTLGAGTEITDNVSVSSGIKIDGVDISEMKTNTDNSITSINGSLSAINTSLSTQVTSINNSIGVTNANVSAVQTISPFAFGQFTILGGGACSGYNIDTTRILHYTKGSDFSYGCYFSTDAGSTNYYVMITYYAEGSSSPVAIFHIHHKQSDGFSVMALSSGGNVFYPSRYDFVVFKQP
ncbi:MAG: hypothetical protein HQM16_17725 [Deltaproteobacteria bacterium]|nr:hypothetical protein [Deltaproteobacteria bacterium]